MKRVQRSLLVVTSTGKFLPFSLNGNLAIPIATLKKHAR